MKSLVILKSSFSLKKEIHNLNSVEDPLDHIKYAIKISKKTTLTEVKQNSTEITEEEIKKMMYPENEINSAEKAGFNKGWLALWEYIKSKN